MKIVSLSHIESENTTPHIDMNLLTKYKDGLIITSSGLDGELTYYASNADYDNAKQVAAEQDLQYLPKEEIEKRMRQKRKHMEAAAKELDFIVAAKLRDEIAVLREQL